MTNSIIDNQEFNIANINASLLGVKDIKENYNGYVITFYNAKGLKQTVSRKSFLNKYANLDSDINL
tara:strand:- start:1167 stop:1364 length:198 start_codon:yes stop_codon:yes gene_type:complete